MSDTLIIQSFRNHRVPDWITMCMRSVSAWAASQGFDYHCADDQEMLHGLPASFAQKVARWPMRTDLGRLLLCRHHLGTGYRRAIWLDADVLVHQPQRFTLPESVPDGYAFGREVWIEDSGKVRRGVHNALCCFERNNPFLDYYIHCCERIIAVHQGEHLAPQLLGPKLLKAHYSYLNFPLLDHVNMLSPAVVQDIISGSGTCLTKQLAEHPAPASNLCLSLLPEDQAMSCVNRLTN